MSLKDGRSNEKKRGSRISRGIRSFFRDWDIKVMTYVMLILASVALIAATVAWFTNFHYNAAGGIGMALGDCDSLKIAIEPGGADIEELKELPGNPDSIEFSMDMPMFDNVESYMAQEQQVATGGIIHSETVKRSKLAPGVYGKVTMYLTSLNSQIDYFRITPSILLTYSDDTFDTMDESSWEIIPPENDNDVKASMRKLVQGHIMFFKEREKVYDNDGKKWKYLYSGQIFPEKDEDLNIGPLEDSLEYDNDNHIGIEKKVTLYWYWAYEYADVPENIQEAVKGTDSSIYAERFFAEADLAADEDLTQGSGVRLTQLYDFADTRIGESVKSMKFHFRVDGYHKLTEPESEPESESESESESEPESETETT